MLRARDVLARDSPLARSLPGYEERAAQLSMADAVEAALAEERPLFVEAGTGTGKTLAYLIPALLSGKKVVVSTATRALQEQIFFKDLPLVEKTLAVHGITFRATMMKGLTNYLCKRRLLEASLAPGVAPGVGKKLPLARSREPSLELPLGPGLGSVFWADPRAAEIDAWAKKTSRGDRAELAAVPEDSRAWLEVQSSTETRIGSTCPFYDECFVTEMKREAELAQLLVVNHHLFFADLALRTGKRGDHASAIPGYDAVIFDEAHHIEDIATDFFGVRLSAARIDTLARDAEKALAPDRSERPSARSSIFEQARTTARVLFEVLGSRGQGSVEGRRILTPEDWTGEAGEAAAKLDLALEALAAEVQARGVGREGAQHVARRAREARADLREIVDGTSAADGTSPAPPERGLNQRPRRGQHLDGMSGGYRSEDDDDPHPTRVAWIHARARTVSVGASPVELGGMLRETLFDRVPVVICTSATLATATASSSSCHFAKARLGAPPETRELVLPSPFDFASRAALYLPRDLPEPNDPRFDAAAAERIAELVRVTGGGAFVLCTSNRAMKRIHDALAGRIATPLLLQGTAPKQTLLDGFKQKGDAVLVATMSFWEGVDVPGRALRLVILDRIPFAVPTDPIVLARCAALDRSGGNSFAEYSIPSAAITLKQGFGRLLRSEKDLGIVAILDRRMTTRGYGKRLLAALPPARRMTSLDDVRAFWEEVTAAA
jgi:ATP-dependent DNA helicase DinG